MFKSIKYIFLASLILLVAAWSFASELDEIRAAIEEHGYDWVADNTSKSILSAEERENLCGAIVDSFEQAEQPENFEDQVMNVPGSWDWRNVSGKNWMTSVKDQASCGSCWAFASLGEMEAVMKITTNNNTWQPDLAEQHLVSTCCSAGDCGGGNVGDAHTYLVSSGAPDEACFPYVALNKPCSDTCSDWVSRAEKLHSWSWVCMAANVSAIKTALQTAPLSTHLDVYEDFYYYQSGVYQHSWGDYVGLHAVVIVGYDDANGSWICKNSWGTGWGESGYFKIKWGNCNIGNWTVLSTYENIPQECVEIINYRTSAHKSACDPTEKKNFSSGNPIQFNVKFNITCDDYYYVDYGIFKNGNLVHSYTYTQWFYTETWCAWYQNYVPANVSGSFAYACRVRSATASDIGGYPALDYIFTIAKDGQEVPEDLLYSDWSSVAELGQFEIVPAQ